MRSGTGSPVLHPVLLALLLILAPTWVGATAISNVQISPPCPTALQFGQDVTVTFDYETEQPDGLKILVRPYSGGSLAPHYSASGSPFYPTGSGSGSGTFTITSGEVHIDGIRFQVYKADQSELLLEFHVAASVFFGDHGLHDVTLSVSSPNGVQLDQHVEIDFAYQTDYPGGVRIFALPFTDGLMTPFTEAGSSGLYPIGSGTGSTYVTVYSQPSPVDHIRMRMYNADMTEVLLEYFIPVDYQFADNVFSNVQFTPAGPRGMPYDERVTIDYDYAIADPNGAYIFARPYTDGAWTPGMVCTGSPVHGPGTGSESFWIRVQSGEHTIDHIHLFVTDLGETVVYHEYFFPVNYHYNEHYFFDLELDPPTPAYFTLGHHDDVTFGYESNYPDDVFLFVLPSHQGGMLPGMSWAGSPIYPSGIGVGSGYVLFLEYGGLIDALHLRIRDLDLSLILMEWFVPVQLLYGGSAPAEVAPAYPVPAAARLTVTATPNPCAARTTLAYALPAEAVVDVRLLDLLGREVLSAKGIVQSAGRQSISLATASLANGIYFCRLEARGARGRRVATSEEVRLVVLR